MKNIENNKLKLTTIRFQWPVGEKRKGRMNRKYVSICTILKFPQLDTTDLTGLWCFVYYEQDEQQQQNTSRHFFSETILAERAREWHFQDAEKNWKPTNL